MKLNTPLGEYPFEFSRLERREGARAVVGTIAGIESTTPAQVAGGEVEHDD